MLADLRAAILSLPPVPAGTPVIFGAIYGGPSMVKYDERMGVIYVDIGFGSSTARPTIEQLHAWLGLPSKLGLAGAWSSMRGNEPLNARGILTFASAAASGYHGVVRNHGSVFAGLVWFIAGAILPGIVPVIAVAQGYAAPRR